MEIGPLAMILRHPIRPQSDAQHADSDQHHSGQDRANRTRDTVLLPSVHQDRCYPPSAFGNLLGSFLSTTAARAATSGPRRGGVALLWSTARTWWMHHLVGRQSQPFW